MFDASVVVLCALALPVLGCGGHSDSCNIPTCDNGIYSASLESGSVAWSHGGVPLDSASVVTGSAAAEGCTLTTTPGKIGSPSNPQPWQTVTSMSLTLTFELAGSSQPSVDGGVGIDWVKWQIRFANLGDPRSWAVGAVGAPDAQIEEDYTMPFSGPIDGAPTCCMTSEGIGNSANLRIEVEQAVGGAAEFPLLVTPDYGRVFRLAYDGASGGRVAGDTARLSLRFTQTAADFSTRREACTSGFCK
jgi:hypothetical protein